MDGDVLSSNYSVRKFKRNPKIIFLDIFFMFICFLTDSFFMGYVLMFILIKDIYYHFTVYLVIDENMLTGHYGFFNKKSSPINHIQSIEIGFINTTIHVAGISKPYVYPYMKNPETIRKYINEVIISNNK